MCALTARCNKQGTTARKVKRLVIAFNCACHITDAELDASAPYRVLSGSVFNALMVGVLAFSCAAAQHLRWFLFASGVLSGQHAAIFR